MKANVGVVELFNLQVNGVLVKGLIKESSWEGIHLLRAEDGQFIIVDCDPLTHRSPNVVRMSGDLYEECNIGVGSADLGKFFGPFEPTHTHNKKGSEYQLLYVSNTKATKPGWDQFAVYTDGETIWTRPVEMFNERYTRKA